MKYKGPVERFKPGPRFDLEQFILGILIAFGSGVSLALAILAMVLE